MAQVQYYGTGRRKDAIARVRLVPGEGKLLVNDRLASEYFLGHESLEMIIKEPLEVTNTLNKYDVLANVTGGGISGQAGALRLGIARALLQLDESLGAILRQRGFLTRDPRMVERKKYGQKKARKRFQWTKR